MPLFSLAPKDDRKGLYGRDREFEQLVRLIRQGRWAVILGPRMVGKTSLVKAASGAGGRPTVYVNLWGAHGTEGLLNAFLNGLGSNRPLLKRLQGALRRVTGVSLVGSGITLAPTAHPMGAMADLVSVIGEEAPRSVIILDEVQELAPSSGALLKVLANVFNTHPEVVFLFTGSYFGILRTLLEPPADSPLYGRSPVRFDLDAFDRPTSIGFLERGLREFDLPADREGLGAIVDRSLDGIPGWLALFGNGVAVQRLSLAEAERATLREGRKVARSELAHFLKPRDTATYWRALRVLTSPTSWTELREALVARRGGHVNEHTVGNVLRALRDAGLIVESNHQYQIRDPMVRSFVRSTSRAPP
jgi:uncharacterized protein